MKGQDEEAGDKGKEMKMTRGLQGNSREQHISVENQKQ